MRCRTGLIAILALLSLGWKGQEDFAKARAAYEERMKEIDKKLKKKRKSKKGKNAYLNALSQAKIAMLENYELAIWSVSHSKPRNDATKKIKEGLIAEMEALQEEMETLRQEGALAVRPPVRPAPMRWEPLAGGVVKYGEHFTTTEFDADHFFSWLGVFRSAMHTKRPQKEPVPIHIDKANAKGEFEPFFGEGRHYIAWFYFRAKEAQKVKISISLSKGDKLVKAYPNFKAEKKTKFSADFRAGTNVLALDIHNKKNPALRLSVKVEGKGIEIGYLMK